MDGKRDNGAESEQDSMLQNGIKCRLKNLPVSLKHSSIEILLQQSALF